MIVYRIAKTKHINDLSGVGARLYGGRWNRKGIAMVYTSETRSLATVEYLVHVPLAMVPDDISIATIEIPEDIIPKEVSISELTTHWRTFPAPNELAELGTRWALSNETLLLRVPSAVVEHEFNILINPSHHDIKRIAVSHIEAYRLDKRLFH